MFIASLLCKTTSFFGAGITSDLLIQHVGQFLAHHMCLIMISHVNELTLEQGGMDLSPKKLLYTMLCIIDIISFWDKISIYSHCQIHMYPTSYPEI